jgi:hypothetical protein
MIVIAEDATEARRVLFFLPPNFRGYRTQWQSLPPAFPSVLMRSDQGLRPIYDSSVIAFTQRARLLRDGATLPTRAVRVTPRRFIVSFISRTPHTGLGKETLYEEEYRYRRRRRRNVHRHRRLGR